MVLFFWDLMMRDLIVIFYFCFDLVMSDLMVLFCGDLKMETLWFCSA